MILGIDYGSKLAGTTAACWQDHQALHLTQSAKKQDADQWLEALIQKLNPDRVFIDAPLSLPKVFTHPSESSDYFYRAADRQLGAMSPMFLGGLTARAMRLVHTCSSRTFFETYPKAVLTELGMMEAGYKKEADLIAKLSLRVSKVSGMSLAAVPGNWHQFDALLAWTAGWRYDQGKAKSYGEAGEGLIWV